MMDSLVKDFLMLGLLTMGLSSCEKSKEDVISGDTYFDGAYEFQNTASNRIGAICNDGTRSKSTGSGTCSGHGGVNVWLCK